MKMMSTPGTHQDQNKKSRSTLAVVKNSDLQKGTVKFFNSTKGFGFIKSRSGTEYFVHANGLTNRIKENDMVSFELKNGPRGLQAIKVSLV